MDLTTCRTVGMAEGPIPWLAIMQYGDRIPLGDFQMELLEYHIRSLDNAYLKYRAKEIKRAENRGK